MGLFQGTNVRSLGIPILFVLALVGVYSQSVSMQFADPRIVRTDLGREFTPACDVDEDGVCDIVSFIQYETSTYRSHLALLSGRDGRVIRVLALRHATPLVVGGLRFDRTAGGHVLLVTRSGIRAYDCQLHSYEAEVAVRGGFEHTAAFGSKSCYGVLSRDETGDRGYLAASCQGSKKELDLTGVLVANPSGCVFGDIDDDGTLDYAIALAGGQTRCFARRVVFVSGADGTMLGVIECDAVGNFASGVASLEMSSRTPYLVIASKGDEEYLGRIECFRLSVEGDRVAQIEKLWTRRGEECGEAGPFGASVNAVVDFTGDGIEDVAIGSPDSLSNEARGSVLVLDGATGELWRCIRGPRKNDCIGVSVRVISCAGRECLLIGGGVMLTEPLFGGFIGCFDLQSNEWLWQLRGVDVLSKV